MPADHVLILGGTGDARRLAEHLHAAGVLITSSFAGVTGSPRLPPGRVRHGGFGGAEALAAWLVAEAVTLVVDATHPFAATMSAHAVAACTAAGVPRLAVVRRPWQPQPGDRWITVADAAEAAARLPGLGRHALLTLGVKDLHAFTCSGAVRLTARLVTPPDPPPPDIALIVARGPFPVEAERALIQERGIDVIVSKDSGGPRTGKLDAAQQLGLPVVLLRRPPPPPPPAVDSAETAVAWVLERLRGSQIP